MQSEMTDRPRLTVREVNNPNAFERFGHNVSS